MFNLELRSKTVNMVFLFIISASGQWAMAADVLPPVDVKVLQDYQKDPTRIEKDQAFAVKVAENGVKLFYNRVMQNYMADHHLNRPPIPYSVLQPHLDYLRKTPLPILDQIIVHGVGLDLIILLIETEIAKYEVDKGLPISVVTPPFIPQSIQSPKPTESGQLTDASAKNDGKIARLETQIEGLNRARMIGYCMDGVLVVLALACLFTARRRRS